MYKYIIFDVDGTMLDTEKAVNDAYQSVIFQKYGRYFSDEEILKGYGVPTEMSLTKYGFTDINAAMHNYYKYLKEGLAKCKAFDGIIEILDKLKALGITLGIVTSRKMYEIEIDACLQGIINKFDALVSSGDTTLHKPHAEPLLKVLEKLNANPEETLYIGDTVFDRACAKNAGVKYALALWGSNNADNIDADYFLKKPSDLLEII